MIPRRIDGANHYLGAPAGWTPDKEGDCGHLAIRTQGDPRHGSGWCESAWEPTPKELEAIKNGASIVLRVWGWQPPVAIYVEHPRQDDKPAEPAGPIIDTRMVADVCLRCEAEISPILAFCTNGGCPVRPLLRGKP